jgi:hypothetical protein
MRNIIRFTLLAAASIALLACKPKPAPPPPVADTSASDAAAEAAARHVRSRDVQACSLTMTAPDNADWATYWTPRGGPSTASSIHWSNDSEKKTQAKLYGTNALVITCSNAGPPSIAVTLDAMAATADDVPMGSGSYPIVGTGQPPVKGAQFLAKTLTYAGRNFSSRTGTIAISTFNSERVEGSFTIDGVETNEAAAPFHLEGTFTIPCSVGSMQSECTAE